MPTYLSEWAPISSRDKCTKYCFLSLLRFLGCCSQCLLFPIPLQCYLVNYIVNEISCATCNTKRSAVPQFLHKPTNEASSNVPSTTPNLCRSLKNDSTKGEHEQNKHAAALEFALATYLFEWEQPVRTSFHLIKLQSQHTLGSIVDNLSSGQLTNS